MRENQLPGKLKNPEEIEAAYQKLENLSREALELDIQYFAINKDIDRHFEEGSRQICNMGECFLKSFKDQEADFSSMELISESQRPLGPPQLADSPKPAKAQPCSPMENIKSIERVMRSMCVWLPPTAGVRGAESMKMRGTQKPLWKSMPVSGHAIVVSGVATIDGKPHFTFRNTWNQLDAKDTALSFEDACRLSDIGIVVNRDKNENESMSEAQAWIHSSTQAPTTE